MKKEPVINQLLKEWEGSSLSMAEFCRRKNINKSTFYSWRRKKNPPQTKINDSFSEVIIESEEESKVIKIVFPNGLRLEVPL